MEFKPTLTSHDPKTGKVTAAMLPLWYAPERCTDCDEMISEVKELSVDHPGVGRYKYKATVNFCKLVEAGNPCKVTGEIYRRTPPPDDGPVIP